ELDRRGDIDRKHRVLVVRGRSRQFTPILWSIFSVLVAQRGQVVAASDIITAVYGKRRDRANQALIREHIRRLEVFLSGSHYRVIRYRGHGFELVVVNKNNERSDGLPMADRRRI